MITYIEAGEIVDAIDELNVRGFVPVSWIGHQANAARAAVTRMIRLVEVGAHRIGRERRAVYRDDGFFLGFDPRGPIRALPHARCAALHLEDGDQIVVTRQNGGRHILSLSELRAPWVPDWMRLAIPVFLEGSHKVGGLLEVDWTRAVAWLEADEAREALRATAAIGGHEAVRALLLDLPK